MASSSRIAAPRTCTHRCFISTASASRFVSYFVSIDLTSLTEPCIPEQVFASPRLRVDPEDPKGVIPPKGSLALNYADGDGQPLTFELAQGRDVEVGFLRIFLTPEPVDLSAFDQYPLDNQGSSSADDAFMLEEQDLPFTEPGLPFTTREVSEWDVVTLPIVLQRGA
jgi:hypothetical protein